MTAFAQRYPPITLTRAQLMTTLGPLCVGYPWGEDTIGDLWEGATPSPSPRPPGAPEQRILFPARLLAWLVDVLARRGDSPEDVAAYLRALQTGVTPHVSA